MNESIKVLAIYSSTLQAAIEKEKQQNGKTYSAST